MVCNREQSIFAAKGKKIYKMFTERQKTLIKKAVNKAIDQGQRSGSMIIWDVENNGGIAANFTLKGEHSSLFPNGNRIQKLYE